MVGYKLFQRHIREDGPESEFAATVALSPPGYDLPVRRGAPGRDSWGPAATTAGVRSAKVQAQDLHAPDSQPPDSLPPDSLPPDSLPPDSLPPDSLPPDWLTMDSLPPDSLPPEPMAPPPANALPPDVVGADPLAPDPLSLDSIPPDSIPPDSIPPDSQPPDSDPYLAQDSLPPSDSLPPDSLPPDSLPPDSLPPAFAPTEAVPLMERQVDLALEPTASAATRSEVLGALAADGRPSPGDLEIAARPTISEIGRYALKHCLGQGGLGQVHEAWDPLLSRPVAIKTLHFSADGPSRSALDRLFLNEARAIASLSHPHIVTVFDAGLSPQGVYLAMERLQGCDLRRKIADGWQPSPGQAAHLVRRLADALAYAHARGVVHCDIKPANIFITTNDKPKILDFGIARIAHGRALATMEGWVAGSPHYLAPEQLRNEAVDARTDVYALGVVFYELLAGRKAFTGDSVEQITVAVLTNHPAPANELRHGVSPTLAHIAAKAMARDPDERYASASAMAFDLRRWLERHSRPRSRQPESAPSSHDRSATARAPAGAGRRRAPGALLLAGAAGAAGFLILLAGAATWAFLRADDRSAAAPMMAAAPIVMAGGTPAPASDSAPASAATASSAATVGSTAPSGAAEAATATTPAMTGATATTADAASGAANGPAPAPAASPQDVPATVPANPPAAGAVAPAARPTPARTAARPRPPSTGGTADTRPFAGAPANGTLQLAIAPWGQVEVNGRSMGITPPLTQLVLPPGTHQVIVRNADYPPFIASVQVQAERPVTLRHRFGP